MKQESDGQTDTLSGTAEEFLEAYPGIYYIASTGNYAVAQKDGSNYLIVNRTSLLDLFCGDPDLGRVGTVVTKRTKCTPIIAAIMRRRSVDLICNIAGYPKGIHDLSGIKILVPKGYVPPPMKKGPFPFIKAFFDWMDRENRDAALSWLHMAVDKIHNHRKRHLQALMLTGPAGTGKSLLLAIIKGCLGASANPYTAFCGKTEFNGEILTSPLLLMDDMPNVDRARYSTFYNNFKQVIMSDEKRCRFMRQDGFSVSPIQAIVCSMNNNPGNLMSLPTYEDALKDKFVVLLFDKRFTALPKFEKLVDKDTISMQLEKELPCFLEWLKNDFEVPATMWPRNDAEQRYKLRSFWNAEVAEECRQNSAADRIWDLIEDFMGKNHKEEWSFTADKLKEIMTLSSNSDDYRELLHNTRTLGHSLKTLSQDRPNQLVRGKRTTKGFEWQAFLTV